MVRAVWRVELNRKIEGEDPGLEIIDQNVAGIHVGNESHMVSVPADRARRQESAGAEERCTGRAVV